MDRVALVIGNSDYLNVGKLNNPRNDANDIASILGKLNFDVEKVIDADLLDGFYTVEVSSPIYSVLPERIQHIFGERNRNIYGSCVKFDPIGGNTIHFSFGLIIKENLIRVIDFQEKMSVL